MFDSHCHLHDERMAQVRDEALRRARAAGVSGMLLAGVDAAGWAEEARLRAANPDLAVAYGLHPQVVPALDDEAAARQLALLGDLCAGRGPLPRPAALGELGLDALSDETRACLGRQEELFRAQLRIAREADLPLVLHILRTHPRTLQILQEEGVPGAGGVVHSYSGSAELVPRYLELGLHLSFAGTVTFPNARRVLSAVRAVPRERLLVETDAPDQTPAPQRPEQNEPAFLPTIIAALATIRGEDAADVARYTEDNARRLLRLPPRNEQV